MLLMKQGEQAWLQMGAAGNHEFARLAWLDDGKGYRLAGGAARLGIATLAHCSIEADGAKLQWSTGHKSSIPQSWFQYTYR